MMHRNIPTLCALHHRSKISACQKLNQTVGQHYFQPVPKVPLFIRGKRTFASGNLLTNKVSFPLDHHGVAQSACGGVASPSNKITTPKGLGPCSCRNVWCVQNLEKPSPNICKSHYPSLLQRPACQHQAQAARLSSPIRQVGGESESSTVAPVSRLQSCNCGCSVMISAARLFQFQHHSARMMRHCSASSRLCQPYPARMFHHSSASSKPVQSYSARILQHCSTSGQHVCGFRPMSSSSHITGLRLSEEVREAVHAGKPVVALESTIITHGMPHPHNQETALAVEQVIRDCGAIPATVGVLKGHVRVGLSGSEIQWLAEKSSQLVKISRRDIPVVLAKGLSGGTTVSGTMIAAHKAGIPIFATGGIGGVHRGVEETQDVSADLRELGRTPVAVIAAGVKSILDIARTLEYLETEGVCVVTFGPATDFPAFFTPRSGHSAPYNVRTPEAAADIVDASLSSGLESGMLFAVPIPEEFSASGETIELAIREAVDLARRSGVKGKEVTPFILQQVNKLTKGASLDANIALVKNNARVAAQIAVALSRKRNARQGKTTPASVSKVASSSSPDLSQSAAGKAVVIGGAVVDFCAKVKEENIKMSGATYAGKIYQSFGGVGRNIADCMSRLGNAPLFVSALGDDVHASALISNCSHMDLRGVSQLTGQSTPTYCPVLTHSGHLMFGIGDMDLHSLVSPDMISQYQDVIAAAPIVCVDGNFSAAIIERVCQLCFEAGVPVWFEPTDIHKATKPLQTEAWSHITYTSPNLHEAACLWTALTGQPEKAVSDAASLEDVLKVAVRYCTDLLRHIPVVMVTLGRHGLVLGQREQDNVDGPKSLLYYPAGAPGSQPQSIVNVSGAGDCLNAGIMHFIIQGHDLDLCVKAGLLAAQHSLQSHSAVPVSITPESFTAEKVQEWARFSAADVGNVV